MSVQTPISTFATAPPDSWRRARQSRDTRFDGRFFVAVSSTGIYCRPICPARLAAEHNVSYYLTAAQSAAAGYRPCLRCRPETAPGSPAWQGSTNTLQRALKLILDGALDSANLPQLCERLGIGERYLRKLFQRELGLSPQAVAHHRRLLFARQLLLDSDMTITDAGFAAGFKSVRRFNSALREAYGMSPSELRQRRRSKARGIQLRLDYRPPYDWEGVIDFFARHAIDGLEEVSARYYRRRFICGQTRGEIELTPRPGSHSLNLKLYLDGPLPLLGLVSRIRRMFDLDAHPQEIAETLGRDPALDHLLQRWPGIRSPVCWSTSEACVRAIAGQQVSIAAARTVLSRLARYCGPLEAFPLTADIASAPDSALAMPGRRRETLRKACALLARGEPAQLLQELNALAGIGPWTISMVAMRGLGEPDIMPPRDLGLEKAWAALPGRDQSLKQAAENWAPWRSYAANLLWRSL